MGVLSEAIFAAQKTKRDPITNYISISSFFPCPYRMYLTYTAQDVQENTPKQILNMDDGHDQEAQAVRRLAEAGIKVENSQKVVSVGRAGTRGHIDGTVKIGETTYLWEHKAMASDRFWEFKRTRYQTYPGYMAQIQAYMAGLNLTKTLVQVKNKEDNDIDDAEIPLDVTYANKIIAWVDSIKLQNWVPEPLKSEACLFCGINCFGRRMDFSKVASMSVEEVTKKWRDGKMYQALGESLEAEARAYLIGTFDKTGERINVGLIGDKENIVVDDLKIAKQVSRRSEIDKNVLIKDYGLECLEKALRDKIVTSYVIRDLKK